MEAQLGRLAGVIRTKDAEAAALNAAVQRQFAERAELRGQVAALDEQVLRLQGSHADIEARLRDSEARCDALDAKHNRRATAFARALRPDAAAALGWGGHAGGGHAGGLGWASSLS